MLNDIRSAFIKYKPVLIFNHIPKASGKSVIHALRENYGDRLFKWHPAFNHDDQFIRENDFKFDCIASHYGYGIQNIFRDNWRYYRGDKDSNTLYTQYMRQFKNRVKLFDSNQFVPLPGIFGRSVQWITILRDPIERLISYYNFVTKFKVHRHYDKTRNMGVSEFCEYLVSINDPEITNLQCGLLSNKRDARATIDVIESEYLLAAPMAQHDAFLAALAMIKKLPKKDSIRMNVSDKSIKGIDDLPRKTLRLLWERNKEDILLFDYVSRVYWPRRLREIMR